MHPYKPSGEKGYTYFALSTLYLILSFLLGSSWALITSFAPELFSQIQHFAGEKIFLYLVAFLLWVLLPVVAAWMLNRFGIAIIRQGHCRSPSYARKMSWVVLTLFYASFQALSFALDGSIHWLSYADTVLLPHPSWESLWLYIGIVIEWTLIGKVLSHFAEDHTKWPFCEACLAWLVEKQYLLYSKESQKDLLENFNLLEWKNNPVPLLEAPEGLCLELSISLCPKCHGNRGAFLLLKEKEDLEDEEGEDLSSAMMKAEEWEKFTQGLPPASLKFRETPVYLYNP